LNVECTEILNQVWDDTLIAEPFNLKEDEREYNSKFIDQNGMLVFDTITPENIELCDILKYDNEFIHLIHVKKGFNNSIRDLAAQVSIAAKRIMRDRKSGYKYITEVELQTKRGSVSKSEYLKKLSSQSFPMKGLQEIFEKKLDKKIGFCLAFIDTAKADRNLKTNIELFDSNIAKYSLIELRREINSLGFDFKVIQLKRAVA
jgi:uncharacterized protein (TIGR04141 family)